MLKSLFSKASEFSKALLYAPAKHGGDYRPDVDGLRAIAVLAVVVYHAFPARLSGGFVGVDVFFVISGFLISTILLKELDAGRYSYLNFVARRLRRIAPALILVLAATSIAAWYILLDNELIDYAKQVIAGSAFFSNIHYWKQAGYFDTIAESKPLLHLWSLGIEEQYYIFWPLLLFFLHKTRLRKLSMIAFVIAVSFMVSLVLMENRPVAAFYLLPTRLWELGSGALLAHINLRYRPRVWAFLETIFLEHRPSSEYFVQNILSFLGLILIISAFYLTPKETFPGFWPVLPVLGSCLFIFAGKESFINRYAFSLRPMIYVGLISYPLYLWHWPVLSYAYIIEGGTPSRSMRLWAIALAFLLSIATFHIVEKPFQRMFSNFGKKRYKAGVIATSLLGLSAAAFIGYVIIKKDGFPERRAAKILPENIKTQLEGALWQFTQNDLCNNRYPFPQAKEYGWWFCMLSKKEPPTVLLLGNSFANHLYPGLALNPAIQRENILSIGTCNYSQLGGAVTSTSKVKADFSPCAGNRAVENANFISSIIKTEKSIKYVILAGEAPSDTPAYLDNVYTRIKELKETGRKIALFLDHPTNTDTTVMKCYQNRILSTKRECQFFWKRNESVDAAISKLKAKFPDIIVFDPSQQFSCNAKTNQCDVERLGLPMFRDEYEHMSKHASMLVGSKFLEIAQRSGWFM